MPVNFRTILVTGASRGLGFELCRLLLIAGGSHVVAVGRTFAPEALARLRATLAATRTKTSKRVSELTTIDGVDVAVAGAGGVARRTAAALREQKLDVLVNCAGIYPQGWDAASFSSAMDVNTRGALRLVRSFQPQLAGDSHVINVSSGLSLLQFQSDAYKKLLADCKSCVPLRQCPPLVVRMRAICARYVSPPPSPVVARSKIAGPTTLKRCHF
jgi:NAD(P)-dependent dehydrogenase (short-subunit alcohol dehydrogenase family)